jgi:small subunit ribosomal protein S13
MNPPSYRPSSRVEDGVSSQRFGVKMTTKYIIRIANTDLNGEKPIGMAMRKIKGVSHMFSHALCYVGGIDKAKKAGDLSEAEEKRLNDLIRNPRGAGVPEWMLNRRNDTETGEDMHLIGSDIAYSKENDIKRMKKLKTYKGLRHTVGLPVRGQRTKSNFRKNKKKGSGKKQARQSKS